MASSDIISILIKRTSLDFDKIANHFLAAYQLTHMQFKILRYLAEKPDLTITQRDLERYFSMTNPAVTGILQNLEKKDLIVRQVNPKDARSKVLGLTAKSHAMSGKLADLNQQMDDQFTKHLSVDEKQQLTVLLKKILGLDQLPDGGGKS